MKLICSYCSKEFTVKANNIGSRNRSIRLGLPIYCNKICAGLARRIDETPEEKREIKTWYDLFIRVSMTEDEKIFKSFATLVYFHIDYSRNPDKYKAVREKIMPRHVEYCRQPEYKKWKKSYD